MLIFGVLALFRGVFLFFFLIVFAILFGLFIINFAYYCVSAFYTFAKIGLIARFCQKSCVVNFFEKIFHLAIAFAVIFSDFRGKTSQKSGSISVGEFREFREI